MGNKRHYKFASINLLTVTIVAMRKTMPLPVKAFRVMKKRPKKY